MKAQRGFTLVEILIALMIFSIVGTAMVSTLMIATQLFESGERQRAAADEAMTVLQILDADLAAAQPASVGGTFICTLNPNTGNCRVEWDITNPDPNQREGKTIVRVVWECSNDGNLFRTVDDQTQAITKGCWYFGAMLAGTNADSNGDQVADFADVPTPNSKWWQEFSQADDPSIPSVPAIPNLNTVSYDSENEDYDYPKAIRFVLMLDPGRIPNNGVVIADDGSTGLRIAGIRQLATGSGRFLRILDGGSASQELVGYYRFDASTGTISVNTQTFHGPLNSSASANGRGIYHSTTPTGGHAVGSTVKAGEIYTVIRALPL